MQDNFSVVNKTGGRLPSMSLSVIKDDILGKKYSLSLAFVDTKKSKEVNSIYRKKNKPTNVLAFPLSKNSGEIIICPEVVRKEAGNFDKTFREFLGFLVIHGMLHLKGMTHSSRMDRAEAKYDKKYFYRNRRGNQHDKNRGGRIHQGRKKS